MLINITSLIHLLLINKRFKRPLIKKTTIEIIMRDKKNNKVFKHELKETMMRIICFLLLILCKHIK